MPYKILGHTADVRMIVQGKTLEEFFRDAVLGMMEIVKPKFDEPEKNIQRNIELEAPDTTALLVDFLNEVLFNANANKEGYAEINFKKLSENSLEAELSGRTVQSFGEDIKAATYHEADVKKNEKGEWETVIIFDI